MIEENGDAASAGQRDEIRLTRRDRLRRLPRRQHRVAHALLDKNRECLLIDSGLGQPHAIGLVAETTGEVIQPPADLRPLVAGGRQRQNRVIIRLGQRVAHAIAREILAIRGDKRLIDVGVMAFKPGGQRWPKVKAYPGEVTRLGIRTITFPGDLLVVVFKGRRARLAGDKSREWIVAGRLIKVSVDTQKLMRMSVTIFSAFHVPRSLAIA